VTSAAAARPFQPAAVEPTASDAAGRRPAGGDAGNEPLMTIGEVLNHLRAEFPETTISKLRFLEAEGLVEPQRTPSGYRKYGWGDVARLRFVLTAQRDQYLPLRVIREQLSAHDFAAARPALVVVGAPAAGAPAPDRETRLSRAELAQRSGLSDEQVADLEQHGLMAARSGGWYDADALTVAVVAAEFARYGLGARHLRAYRAAADREVGLFSQLVAPLLRASETGGRERAAETVRELAGLSQRLHAALVRTGLRETLG